MVRLSLVMLIGLAGCGGGSKTSPVSGVVLLDGKPVADATVQFVPQEKGRDATGQTDKNGEFAIRDGVVPGEYKVVISPPTGVADTTKYTTSEDAMSAAKPQPKKDSGFPQKYSRPDQTPLTQSVPTKGSVRLELKSK
jgi:Carboxypeptidase regulatory-like domain